MGMHELHDQVIGRSYAWRSRWYAPVVSWLARRGVTANGVTAFRVLFIFPIGYYFFVGSIGAAIAWYVAFWILDTLDGSLARAAGTASDRGKFLDVLIDNFVYSFVIVCLIYADAAPAAVLGYHAIIQLFNYLLACIYHNEGRATDWIIKPQGEVQYNKLAAHGLMIAWAAGTGALPIGMMVLNSWLTLQCMYFYRAIHLRAITPNHD